VFVRQAIDFSIQLRCHTPSSCPRGHDHTIDVEKVSVPGGEPLKVFTRQGGGVVEDDNDAGRSIVERR